jgi:hypothetical protein
MTPALLQRLCLLVAVLAAEPPAAADPAVGLHGLPIYPTVTGAPFDGNLETNGIPQQASILVTPDPIERVVAFFQEYITRHELKLTQHMHTPGSGYIGYFDEPTGTMRLASVMSVPEGGTIIVYSTMDPRPLVTQSVTVPADLPALPGARQIVTTQTEEGGARERSVRFEVGNVTPDDARRRLLEAAAALGWQHHAQDKLFGAQAVVLVRAGERCILRVDPVESKTQKARRAVSVTMMVIESAKSAEPKQGEHP